MSHADKSAKRSDAKSKSENRDDFKRNAWNHMPDRLRLTNAKPTAESWWLVGCAPGERAKFIDAWQQRATSRGWTDVVAHADNPSKGFR